MGALFRHGSSLNRQFPLDSSRSGQSGGDGVLHHDQVLPVHSHGVVWFAQNIRSNSGSPFLEELKQARLHGILEVLRTVQLEQSSQFRAKVERRQLLQLVESGCAYRSVVTSDLILVDETNFPSKRFVSKVRIDLGCCTSNVWFGSAQ